MLDGQSELDLTRINMSEMRTRTKPFNNTELHELRQMACRSKQESVPPTLGNHKHSLDHVLAQTMQTSDKKRSQAPPSQLDMQRNDESLI